jgi:hypothetical protein
MSSNTTITYYLILAVILLIILYQVYYWNIGESRESRESREKFDNSTEESQDSLESTGDSAITPQSNLQCIAKLKLSSPLQTCTAIASGVSGELNDYDTLVDNIASVLDGMNQAIITTGQKYDDSLSQLIKTYATNENLIRQQNYFKSQNGNVLEINNKFKTDLSNKTSSSKETYNIQLDLFNKTIADNTSASSKVTNLIYYSKIVLYGCIVVLFANILIMEFKD